MARAAREPLSRARVLQAAVGLADAEGVASLTMRRLAGVLGVEAMSLYHHLPGKDALLDGLVESVIAEVNAEVAAAPGDADDWRARLRSRFLAARRVMLRHPWAPVIISSRSGMPAEVMIYYDGVLATLIDAGFSYRLAHRAMHAFGSMPLGFVQELFAAPAGDGAQEEADGADLAAMAQAVPHLAAMVASEIHDAADPTLGWCDSQTEFEFTLDLLLDGLERLRVEDERRARRTASRRKSVE